MRHVIIEEPYSKAALLSRRLAVFALAVAVIGILGVAHGLDRLAVLGGAAAVALCAVLLAIVALAIIWHTGRKGAGQALAGLLLAMALLAYPAYLALQAIGLPRLSDISTDLSDPPGFSLSRSALAARDGATPPILPLATRKEQIKAYPKIQPILVDLDQREAFDAALKAVAANGWKTVEQTPPSGRMGIGHIDAIARSLIVGFPSDITLRLRPLAGQTRIDIRSVSRFGDWDLGSGPRNIANFESALQEIVDKK